MRARIAKRVDANQSKIVEQLRRIGATVQVLSSVGQGCPDILVGYRTRNFLFEIKDGAKIPSKKKLTPDEEVFFQTWQGQVHKVESIEEILKVIE